MAKLVYVMGPSGAGKDTLMRLVKNRLKSEAHPLPLVFVRRYITRPAAPSEDHIPVSEARFAELLHSGQLALSWQSHNLFYGIAQSVDEALQNGVSLVVGGSREALPRALDRFPSLLPVLVNAELSVLRERLRARGREDDEDMEERLSRASLGIPRGVYCPRVDNSGDPRKAADDLYRILRDACENAEKDAEKVAGDGRAEPDILPRHVELSA